MVIKACRIHAVKLFDAPLEIALLLPSDSAQKNHLPMGFDNGDVWSRMAMKTPHFNTSFALL